MAKKHPAFNPDCPDCVRQMRRPRLDRGRKSVYLARAKGWVMVRRPGCIPYTMTEKDWVSLPFAD